MTDYQTYNIEIESLSKSEIDPKEKLFGLKKILERLVGELTAEDPVQFPNLFSKLVFVAQKLNLTKRQEWQLQNLRVRSKTVRSEKKKVTATEYRKHERVLLDFIHFLANPETEVNEPEENPIESSREIESGTHLRVQIKEIDNEKSMLRCLIEKHPGTEAIVKFNVKNVNDAFNDSISRFWKGAQLNLIDFTIDKNGHLIPKLIVLEPDYLIDASAIAECFHDYCISPMHYFRNKFETIENRSYILLGNLANFFLDELVFADDVEKVSFGKTFFQSFKQSPFEYTSCKDIAEADDFRQYMTNAQSQFNNIKRVITADFPGRNIDLHASTLEPSFFSEKYGFQGRLDMLHTDGKRHNIIELKSGKLPYPAYDVGKIALNHEVQTSVYRFMIESVFGVPSRKVEAAILYSSGKLEGTNLRFAAEFQKLEKEIINVRNHIVANEHLLMNGNNETVERMFQTLYETVSFSKATAKFYTEKIENFKKVLQQCNQTELAYFYRFIRFITRELYLQKIGDIHHDSPAGVASLWNSDFSERAEALDVLFDLTIESIDDSDNDMAIVFQRNHAGNEIVNFREGEICIVYPRQDEQDTVLNRQILKGTISAISKEFIEIRFRHKQRNRNYFNENKHWAVEHDTLDTSHNSMYRGLFSFLNAAKQKRELLLGMAEPKHKEAEVSKLPYPENVIQKALAAEDYFLIVGPPGTGKTSIFARRLIEEYHADPRLDILVLAYTNRAVDELCDAINAAMGCTEGNSDRYIRIGTQLSCNEKYRDRLLQNVSERAESREELRSEIQKTRIFVSTLASINGKQELFALKKFDVAIIDEASQILEPQIIGLLPNFEKFILIGDHNQLPAIVLQKNSVAAIREPELNEIGFRSCAHSLFERLLQRAESKGWKHAFTQLTMQGRMHDEIAAFPSQYFYPEKLLPVSGWQSESWKSSFPESQDIFLQTISKRRTAFFSTENLSANNLSAKTNENEANTVVSLVQAIQAVYKKENRLLDFKDIGIITPYRNQIALIKHKLQIAGIDGFENIMVDTVERFQGSQRDVIIVSFCVNQPYQFNFLCNLNDAGSVDRKLNVTLTRARQQMFLIGNADILKRHPIYATLLEHYKENKLVL